jgi:hypothetical protein
MLLEEIDDVPAAGHPLAPFLLAGGFIAGALGLQPRLKDWAKDARRSAGA